MKKVAGTLKLLYSQYRELQAFAQFGSDLDADTKRRLEQGARIVEVLKQDRNAPISVENQVAIMYAVTRDLLSDLPVDRVKDFEPFLFEYLGNHAEDALAAIRTTGALSEETEKALHEAILTAKSRYMGKALEA